MQLLYILTLKYNHFSWTMQEIQIQNILLLKLDGFLMMLIKYKIARDSDGHMIITKVCKQKVGTIST